MVYMQSTNTSRLFLCRFFVLLRMTGETARCALEGSGAHGAEKKESWCAEYGSGAHGGGEKGLRCAEYGSGAHGGIAEGMRHPTGGVAALGT